MSASRRFLLWLVWVALFSVLPLAFGATFFDSEYLIDSWQTEQGLPESTANAMVQTADGYLWIATFNGLVRFDGMKFAVFDRSNTPELPSDGIVNLHLDQSGQLWLSTFKGIAVRKDNKWSVLKKSQVSQSNFIRIFSDAAGVLCATTFDGKVYRIQDGHLVELPTPPGLEGEGYLGHVDRKGTIWVGQAHFFGFWDGQHWIASPLAPVVTNYFRGMGTGHDGSLLTVSGNTLLRIEAGQVTAKSVLAEDPNLLWRVYEDSRSNIWLCTQQNGLYLVSPSGALRHFSTTNGLTEQGIRSAFEDGEKNIWLGSSGGGLMRMKRRTFVQPDMSLFSPTMRMTTLVEESPGRILIGSYGNGLGRRENGRLDRIEALQGGFIPKYIQSVLVGRDGKLWIATYHDGVYVLDKNRVLHRVATGEAGGIDSAALFEDTHGRIWIGGDKTISLFVNGQFQPLTNSPGLSLGGVKCFAEDAGSGAIWAASAEGLFRFEGGRWSEVRDGTGHSLDETICLRADADGTLWIGGSTVPLRRLRAGLLTTIAEAQGLPARVITCLLDDGLGYWWLASNLGVIRVARKDLEQAAGGGAAKLSCQLFNLSDGLPSVECVPGFQSTGLKDSEGRLWFATLKGVVTVDPKTLNLNTKPPPVFINEFRVEKMSGERTSSPTSGLQPIMVAPGQREIMVGFSALSYTAPEKVRFAYKVKGFHDDWMDIGNRSDLYFYPPPPGEYRLQIKAANNDGVWNEKGATLAFTVQPFLWQTVWFRVLALAGMLGGTSWTVWWVGLAKTRRKIDRMEQERALERQRAQLASVMETTSDFVGFSKPDGEVLFINRAGRRMLGVGEAEDVRTIKVADHYPAWGERLVLTIGLPTAIREGTWSGELALKHRDGHEIPVSQVIVAHHGPDGTLDFISTIARDITERKRMETLANGQREVLEKIANDAPLRETLEGLLGIMESQDEELYCSILSLEADGAHLRHIAAPRLPDAYTKAIDGNAIGPSAGSCGTAVFRRQPVFVQDIATDPLWENYKAIALAHGLRACWSKPIFDAQQNILGTLAIYRHQVGLPTARDLELMDLATHTAAIAIGRDRAKAALRETEERLRQVQKMEGIGQLAGGVAHDFNNMLAATMMNLSLLQINKDLSPGVQETVKELMHGAERAANLTRQLLLFSRRSVMEVKLLDLNELVTNLLKMLGRTIGEHIILQFDRRENLPVLEGDAGMIEQVIMNLAVNARDAMPQGGALRIGVETIQVDAERVKDKPGLPSGQFLCLTVADSGCGMDEAVRQRVFEPFFTTKEMGKGTGLGLATVHGIVAQHKGWVEVESEVGKGTTFKVFLPASPNSVTEAPQTGKLAPIRGHETILLVEDEAGVRRLAVQCLQLLGYTVFEAENGQAAIRMWQQRQGEFDLLLSDMVMPEGLTGLDLAEKFKKERPNLKVIISSGYSEEMAGQARLAAHGIVYLQKPYKIESLSKAVRDCLEGKS